MTDNNKIQAIEVPCNKISADLTELWRKGKLPSGEYYIKIDGVDARACYFEGFGFTEGEPEEIEEILDKVPTYEKYQALLSDQLAKNEGVEINAELEAKNEKLRQEIKEWQKMARRILPALIPVQKDMKTLIETLLKVSPEHKAWLEKNYKEYL